MLMVGIARSDRGQGEPVSTKELAAASGIPRRYLEQLTVPLKNAALIRGHCGRGGGYTLSRSASSIRVGEILSAVSGPLQIADCVTDPSACAHSAYCTCRMFWRLLHEQLTRLMDTYTLADLMGEGDDNRIEEALGDLDAAWPPPGSRDERRLPMDHDCPRRHHARGEDQRHDG